MSPGGSISRRAFLGHGIAASALLGFARRRAEAQDVGSQYYLRAAEGEVTLGGGRSWNTWMYNQQVPGPLIRVRQGERLRVTLSNRLPGSPTTIHWHGVPVPNEMDGVPGLTQDAVLPGDDFVYEFTARASGTYLYHSHVGLQLDRGLVGALVVDPPEPDTMATREVVLLFDDWLPGSPDDAAAAMQPSASSAPIGNRSPARFAGAGMAGGSMAGTTMATDPAYAGLLVNGQLGTAPDPVNVRRGERIRLRLLNASAATTLRVGINGHRMRVTHADAQAVQPVDVDTLILGMGERYDVVVDMSIGGTWTLLAGSVDSAVPGIVLPILYDGAPARVGPIPVWTPQLQAGRGLTYADLRPLVPWEQGPAARPLPIALSQGAAGTWLINGETFENAAPLRVRLGERIRLQFRNMSPVRHPMHLHGHFFHLVDPLTGRPSGAVKDTVIVAPMMGAVDAEFIADNPGRWLLHCHHAYHMEAGMARVVEVG